MSTQDELREAISNVMANNIIRFNARPTTQNPFKDGNNIMRIHQEDLDKILNIFNQELEKRARAALENTDLDLSIGPITVHYLPISSIDRVVATLTKDREKTK